jgi:peptide-methionine (S)-S-oxide reductase
MKLLACVFAVGLVALAGAAPPPSPPPLKAPRAVLPPDPPGSEVALFAAGCFWCVEADFERLEGVLSVTSGYAGGLEKDPTYELVSSGTTGHAESVRVVFDPKKLSYAALLDFFWHHVDPTQANAQFCDEGPQYRAAIFPLNDAQKQAAEASKAALAKSGVLKQPIVIQIVKATTFWPAEEYHQDYYKKQPKVYSSYRAGCGRDARVQEIWQTPAH